MTSAVLRSAGLAVVLTARVLAAPAPAADEAAYLKNIAERADKIVASLSLGDSAKAARASEIVARHYRDLRDIQAERDAQIKTAKAQSVDKATVDAATKTARAAADVKVEKLHGEFLARLGTELAPAQIDQVKEIGRAHV
jgi:hypothetical protein